MSKHGYKGKCQDSSPRTTPGSYDPHRAHWSKTPRAGPIITPIIPIPTGRAGMGTGFLRCFISSVVYKHDEHTVMSKQNATSHIIARIKSTGKPMKIISNGTQRMIEAMMPRPATTIAYTMRPSAYTPGILMRWEKRPSIAITVTAEANCIKRRTMDEILCVPLRSVILKDSKHSSV